MIKKIILLFGLLLVCSSCVSRTVTTPDALTGTRKELTSDKKLIWFWQDDFSK